jgi:predicted transcriptional regulator
MSTAKEEVRRMLDLLPEEASFDDIQYHIYVRQKVERGLQDIAEGRTMSQEEVEQQVQQWSQGLESTLGARESSSLS